MKEKRAKARTDSTMCIFVIKAIFVIDSVYSGEVECQCLLIFYDLLTSMQRQKSDQRYDCMFQRGVLTSFRLLKRVQIMGTKLMSENPDISASREL